MNYSKAVLHCTALYLAAQNGHRATVKYLSELNCDVSEEVVYKSTAFYMAAQNGHLESVKYFMEYIINSENKVPEEEIIPDAVIKTEDLSGICNNEVLIDDELICDLNDDSRQFLIASKQGNIHVLMLMLNKGVDINTTDVNGWSALHFAAVKGHVAIANCLLKNKANVNIFNKSFDKPIHYAARYAQNAIIRLLHEFGANVNDAGNKLNTPLHIAAQYSLRMVMEQLILLGAKNICNEHGYLPIYYASNERITKILLPLGVQNGYKDKVGNTPLHIAAGLGQINIIIAIMKHTDILIHKQNDDGNSPLHIAAGCGNEAVVKILMEKANVEIMNCNGHNVLHHAIDKKQEKIAFLLLDLGCSIKNRTRRGSSVLHIAAMRGLKKIVEFSINSGLIVNNRNSMCYTPLIFSSFGGHVDVARVLIGHGADLNEKDYLKNSALYYATERGSVDFVKLLINHGVKITSNDKSKILLNIQKKPNSIEIARLIEDYTGLLQGQVNNLR